MDYQLWKIYWAFRNGDRDLCAELLAIFWISTMPNAGNSLDSVKGYYGDTLLHLACGNGWLDYVKLLVQEIGYKPEIKDCGKQTPLHYACHYGRLDIVQYLTKVHNCDVTAATRDLWTPLHYACRYGHLNIVEYIILEIPGVISKKQLQYVSCEYYSDNIKFLGLAKKQNSPAIIKPLSVMLQIACSFDQVQIVQCLCNKHGSHRHLSDTEIERLFMFSCKHGLLEIVTRLRPSVSNDVDTQGSSGLHYACQEGHLGIAKYLIEERGCDITKVDNNDNTPLYLACQHSHSIDMIKYILDRLKCTHSWIKALSLMFCNQQWSDSQCIDLMKLLMSTKEWNPTSSCNSNGDTVLHLSAKHNRPDVAEFLLLKFNFQIDPTIRNIKGETPLEQASNPEIIRYFVYQDKIKLDDKIVDRLLPGSTQKQESICVETLKLMIKNRQWDPNSNCNSKGDTALHLSARYHRPMVVHFLLSENSCNPNRQNQDGVTPLDLATDPEIISLLISSERVWQSKCGIDIVERALTHSTNEQDSLCIDILRTLIEAGQWNPTMSCNSTGDTALHLSIRLHRPVLTHFLLSEVKCEPNIKNLKGETPIQLIIQLYTDSECTDLSKQIIATKSWDPHSTCNSEGDTALHLSAWYYRPKLANFLVSEAGCHPNVKNQAGETPLYLLLSLSLWRDSDCVDLIKPLIITKCWDPNSACDSEGNTALHLSAWYVKRKLINLLVFKAGCHPNVKNHRGETPLYPILSVPQWSDSDCITFIKPLITTECWDPNSACDAEGNTVLHLAALHHRPDVAEFLLSETISDPYVKNTEDKIPLQVLIIMPMWSDSECISIIKLLMATKKWNPNSSCSSQNDTVLHLAARHHKCRVVDFLLFEAECDPIIKNRKGETLMELLISGHAWYDSECTSIIKKMYNTILNEQWDPNSRCSTLGDTILHLSARCNRPNAAHFLVSEAKCDLNIGNKRGETPIDLMLSTLSDSECFDIIRDIVVTKQWNPNSRCNSNDDTALHLSVKYHKPRVALFLLSEAKCDPNIGNKIGEMKEVLLMSSSKSMWLESESVNIIKALVQSKRWYPNSRCNFEGDTALHLSARYERYNTVRFLVSEAKCDPYVRNRKGETAIYQMMSKWSNTECINIIRVLMATKQWDSNASCNSKGDTALHLSVRYLRYNTVHFLVSEAKCDPYVRNRKGEMAIYQMMLRWSDTECINIIRVLMATEQWDSNASCNSEGDTALYLSVRYCMTKTVNFLVSEAKCDIYVRNRRGETAIYQMMLRWSDTECINIIRVLMATKQWDSNASCNSEGDTALHLSVSWYLRYNTVHFLVSEAKCDPYVRNRKGETAIHQMMSNQSDTECINIIRVLMATKQWDSNASCNSKGDTALHLSARHHRPEVVHYLLSEAKCDPNSKNLNEETPLQLANDTDIINDLIHYGSNPDIVYKLYGKSVRLKGPLRPSVKVFIIGNSGVGKSTLTEALKIEASLLTRAFAARTRVSDVDEKTAGIVPHDFESKNYGRVTFYDFAGHREFYSSHEAFLQNVIQTSSPTFLLVVNMSAENDIIQQNILYWLSFVENQCSAINCIISHVIVIGSHADIVLSGGDDPQQKAIEISEYIKNTFQSSIVEYVAICPMDCQYPESSGMTKLRQCLIKICNTVRISKVIPFNAHCFHVFLLDTFRASVAVTIQKIQDQIMEEQTMKEGIARFLPDKSTTICEVCDELNNRGHILFLKNADNIENSWVIIDKNRLLSKVTGTIFAPKEFKQHCQLAESTGVVPLSKLTEHFPDLKIEVLIGFMTHLEFCREIVDSELLELITEHQEYLNNTQSDTSTSGLSERYFLFPGLITQQAPDNLWEQNQDFIHHCGWILQCMGSGQFFSSRFLQVLLLRLAFSFALVKVEVEETFPAFQRECSIWKNGIFWGEILGVQILIEVHSTNKTVILQIRSQEEHLLHCIAQRSHIIRKILQCTRDFCPQIKTVESFIDPSEVINFPIKLTPEVSRFNLQKIAEAIIKFIDHYPLSVVSSRRTILLDRLVIFEPYAEIGQTMLRNLLSQQKLNDGASKLSNHDLEILSLKLSRKANFFVKLFKEPRLLSSPTPEDLLTVLQQWRDGCEGTYKCLKEKLDQYSVFAGRNILVSRYTNRKHIHW